MPSHVVYDAILGSGNNLRQVLSSNYRGGLNPAIGRQSGAADPSFFAVAATRPQVDFTTNDVGGALGIIDVNNGLYVNNGTITIPYHLRAQGGTFASGSSHYALSAAYALITFGAISAQQDQEAVTAQLTAALLSADGTTAPVSANLNQALASEAFNALWGMGPVYFGGSQISEAIGWTVNPGIATAISGIDGGVYPVKAYITQRDPTIDVLFEDLDTANSVVGAIVGSMSSAAVYAYKRASGGVFAATNSSVHLKFSFGGGITSLESISMDGVNAGRVSVRLRGLALTASAASTIP